MSSMPERVPEPAPAADGSAHERLVRDYYRTTSAAGDAAHADYAAMTLGLRRGLGDWLDVQGRRVLDLGCGKGELCWLALQAGASEMTGVNLSQDEIDYATPHVPARFVRQDILAYLRAQPEASVDRIYALNILEHLDKDSVVAVLEQAARALAPGGALVAMVPNAISAFGAMTRYWDFTHVLAFTPNSVRQLQRLCGFADCAFREWGPVPHGLVSGVRWLLWQGVRAMTWLRLMIETGGSKDGVYTADMLFRLERGAQ